MTEHDCKFFLENTYPCVILSDRYRGTYSGALWTAFPSDEAPEAVYEDDVTCHNFWADCTDPVGKGNTPEEAVTDLICAVERHMVTEAEKRIEAP